ncbi:hypothetical protein [Limoniibacter endophyticus]|uniref:DUF945 domain-containing protein n=1 Tax=Limoniibacter endophyticus TaxID=1565040 RepID=A0A8J3GGF2_9HYPH|nr:hypothetical protein [Limoniibacter endophyticus]GHC68448.1 hypothetical protein GCM10010136_13170 [Limoniibacter endophyticus]
MSPLRNRAFALASSTLFFSAFSTGAMALDAAIIGADMKAAMVSQGITFDYTDVREDGENIIFSGAKASLADVEGAWEIGELTLDGVSEREGGGHFIDRITLPEVKQEKDGSTFELTSAVLENVSLPANAKSGDFFEDMFYYESINIDRIAVNGAGTFVANDIKAVSSPLAPGKVITSEGSIGEFSVELPPAGSDKTLQVVHALGYETFGGNATFKSSWNPTDGASTLSEGKFTLNDAASINLVGDFGGLTVDVLQAMQELSANAEKSEQNPEAMQLAMLGLMQQMTFDKLTIRLEDNSLMDKVLDYLAQQQGTTKEGLIGQAQFLLPAFLGYFQNPQFTQTVSAEAVKFLRDPKTLTISAQPNEPLPVAQLMTLSQTPQIIPTTLNLTIKAND